ESASAEDREIARLARLPLIKYERERTKAADELGIRAMVLDKIVAAERKDNAPQGQGRTLEFGEPEPWPESVSGADLLTDIEETLAKFIVCEPHPRVAITLWVAATWFEPVAQVAPILNIVSPVM